MSLLLADLVGAEAAVDESTALQVLSAALLGTLSLVLMKLCGYVDQVATAFGVVIAGIFLRSVRKKSDLAVTPTTSPTKSTSDDEEDHTDEAADEVAELSVKIANDIGVKCEELRKSVDETECRRPSLPFVQEDDGDADEVPELVMPRRFISDDVKPAVNRVLLPKLMAHQTFIVNTKKRMRKRELLPTEAKDLIHESSRVFTERYADSVQMAKLLANESGVVPLQRLASTNESWAAAQLMASMSGSELPEDFIPGDCFPAGHSPP